MSTKDMKGAVYNPVYTVDFTQVSPSVAQPFATRAAG